MTLQTETLLQSRELKIVMEKQAVGELKNNLGKFLFLEMKPVKDKRQKLLCREIKIIQACFELEECKMKEL